MAIVLALFVAFFALGIAGGSWRYIAAPLVLSAAVAAFLWARDGGYGHGWGEFGIQLVVLTSALATAATATGIILRRALTGGID